VNKKQMMQIAQLTLVVAGALTMTGYAEARNGSNKIALVSPAELPELARVTGQAMMLHAKGDGRTLLYVEQNNGTRLAIFDVTDPAKIKQKAAPQLDAPGPFDFVTSIGDYVELIRFRDGQGEAVLDLHNVKLPTIKMIPGLKFHRSTELPAGDGFITVSNQATVPSDANPVGYEITANSREPNRVYEVKQVRQEITNHETGTTFLLAADGLYLIRRPAVEKEYKFRDWQMNNPYCCSDR
jgi:hypothetical protein